MFQTLKYFTARIWASSILLLVLGYAALYILHETALPGARFDDTSIQWALFGVSVFFGFFAFGLIGDQKFQNALHILKTSQRTSDSGSIIAQYEELIAFSHSACFLPAKGKRLRDQAIWSYAEYLLSVGLDDSRSVQIYLKAFLQAPDRSKFRAPLLSLFSSKDDLNPKEIDLLLVMLQAENFNDDYLVQYLAEILLEREQFNEKTEPLFIKALQNKSELAEKIVRLALPQLIELKRFDESAIIFYTASLPYLKEEEREIKSELAKKYCEGIWAAMAPGLHHLCGEVFFQLDAEEQKSIREEVDEKRVSGKLKKIRLFSPEDLKQLEKLKKKLGITRSSGEGVKRAFLFPFQLAARFSKFLILKFLDLFIVFGRRTLRFKLISLLVILLSIVAGVSLKEFTLQKKQIKPEPSSKAQANKTGIGAGKKIHTIQVAAGTSKKQAKRLVKSLEKKGLQDVYLIVTPRKTGGNWYKVRVGQFTNQKDARKFARNLIRKKTIKSYFIISHKRK